MKSRIRSKLQKKVLAVNVGFEKSSVLVKILSDMHIEYVEINNTCGNEQIGYLCGFSGFDKSTAEPKLVAEECILFSGIDGKELNILLKDMKSHSISIDLKAICTAYNQRWTLFELTEELRKEHKQMSGGDNGE